MDHDPIVRLPVVRDVDRWGEVMDYEVRFEQAEPRMIAMVRRRATIPELPTVIPAACGEVWAFIRANGIAQPGRNLAVYRGCDDGRLDVEVGAEVPGPFEVGGAV